MFCYRNKWYPARGLHGAADKGTGYSLLETVFAAALFCVVMLVLMSLYPSSIIGLRKGEQMITAANLAQQALETMRAQRFAHMHADAPRTVVMNGVEYIVTVTEFPPTVPDPDLKQFRAVVTWKPGYQGGEAIDRTLSVAYETSFFNFPSP